MLILLCSAMAAEPVLEARMDDEWVAIRVAWADDRDGSLGKTLDGLAIGDRSTIEFDFDGNGVQDPGVDGQATVDPWPEFGGLWWQDRIDRYTTTKLTPIGGRGAVVHDPTRVDTYLIPRATLSAMGPQTRVRLTVDSADDGAHYVSRYLPFAPTMGEIDLTAFPDDFSVYIRPAPMAGQQVAPWTGEWIGEEPTTSPVLLAFWSTWCGSCLQSIPTLEALHAGGLAVVGVNEQSKSYVEAYVRHNPIAYPVLAGSPTAREYGFTGLPHYLLVDADRTVLWAGDHVDGEAIRAAARR